VDDLETAAAQAPLARKIRSFAVWAGAGRKLTQTGKITLSDARHLVELLQTGDTIDPAIGDRVFKTTSSTELGGLTRIAEWAKGARLIRVTGNRLVPVKKNAALLDRPLDLVVALAGAYPSLGRSLFPRGHYRQSLVGDEFADIGDALLTILMTQPAPVPLAGLRAAASEMIGDRYRLDMLTESQLDMLRSTVETDIDIAMAALAGIGVVTIDETTEAAELTALGKFVIGRLRGLPQPGEPIFQLNMTLLDVSDPPVWRRVLVPAAITLRGLHRVIQAAMGWQDYHLHVFRIGDAAYGPDPENELGFRDEIKARLCDVAQVGTRIGYEYDFGDSWEHELIVEAASQAEAGHAYPACTGGEGACPPEDCGGAPGYQELKAILANPAHEEYREMRVWADSQAGQKFDPADFSLLGTGRRVTRALS
jgi:hypothetical protein